MTSVIASRASVANAPGRDGRWLANPELGVYIHIPFCLHRCHYCDFNTYEGLEDLFEPYVDALVADIARWPATASEMGRAYTGPVSSVFFGGGTPTLLPARALGRVLGALADVVGISAGAEVTIEANPETISDSYLTDLLDHGFNRISIGVQSLRPGVLRALGRTHGPERALDAVSAARRAGFCDLNVDLIFGSPWESDDDWTATLEAILRAGPDHVSAYALTVEEGTPLHTLVRTGRIADVDGDVQARRYELACEVLEQGGYRRYEVSNWAKPGRASAHNVLYWSAGDYLGFGAGAHAHLAGRRWWSHRLPRAYISSAVSGATTEAGNELLDEDTRAGEALMLGLRLASGIDLEAFSIRFGEAALVQRHEVITSLQDAGVLEVAGGRLRLVADRTLIANEALCRLL